MIVWKFKKILACSMVAMLLLPLFTKLEHHHEHFVCKAQNEKHFHTHHEKCSVCSFEFSFFLSEEAFIPTQKISYTDCYADHYKNRFNTGRPHYSFLLRAPPATSVA